MIKRRDFDSLSEAQVAAGRIDPRRVAPAARFRPEAPRAVADLLDTIQHVAEAATGERSFLHLGIVPPSAPRSTIEADASASRSARRGRG